MNTFEILTSTGYKTMTWSQICEHMKSKGWEQTGRNEWQKSSAVYHQVQTATFSEGSAGGRFEITTVEYRSFESI